MIDRLATPFLFLAITGSDAFMLLAAGVLSFSSAMPVSLSAIGLALPLIDVSSFVFFRLILRRLPGLSDDTFFGESVVLPSVGDWDPAFVCLSAAASFFGVFAVAGIASFSFTVVLSVSAIGLSLALIDTSSFVFFRLFLRRLAGLFNDTFSGESVVSPFVGIWVLSFVDAAVTLGLCSFPSIAEGDVVMLLCTWFPRNWLTEENRSLPLYCLQGQKYDKPSDIEYFEAS